MEVTGLVLAGGGGKGIYQVGVIKSLAEAGLLNDITAVSGTSIGGVNAVLFAEGLMEGRKDFEKDLGDKANEIPEKLKLTASLDSAVSQMEEAWKEIDYNVFFNVDINSIHAGDRHFSRNATEKLIDKYLSYDLLKKNEDFYLPIYVAAASCPPDVVTTDHITQEEMNILLTASVEETYKNYQIEYMNLIDQDQDYIKNAILATTALPVIYNPVKIGEKLYVDGGAKDNIPIKPLYDLGIRRFIVIELSVKSEIQDIEQFADAEIIDILPSHELGSLISGTLNFDREDIEIKKQIGIRDGKRYIKTLFEKNDVYISIEKELALRDYNDILKQHSFTQKYNMLDESISSRFDYIKNIEDKYS